MLKFFKLLDVRKCKRIFMMIFFIQLSKVKIFSNVITYFFKSYKWCTFSEILHHDKKLRVFSDKNQKSAEESSTILCSILVLKFCILSSQMLPKLGKQTKQQNIKVEFLSFNISKILALFGFKVIYKLISKIYFPLRKKHFVCSVV